MKINYYNTDFLPNIHLKNSDIKRTNMFCVCKYCDLISYAYFYSGIEKHKERIIIKAWQPRFIISICLHFTWKTVGEYIIIFIIV